MHGESAFGPDFQRALIRSCLDDPGLRALVRRFAESGQLGFTDPLSGWAWKVIGDSENPSRLMLEVEMGRVSGPSMPNAQAILLGSEDWRESDYVRQQIVEWARRQVFRAGFDEARDAWNSGKTDEAYGLMVRRMEEVAGIQLAVADRGWFFEEFHDRQARRARVAAGDDFFPIGIDRLDGAMNGGLHYGELEVPVAYSGVGKSFWCVQRGFTAARLRRRVLHFVLEGGRHKIEDRYEARWADILYHDVRTGNLDAATITALHHEYEMLRRNLVLRGYADKQAWRITYDDLTEELSELRRAHGWVPDLVIVDYGDLLDGPGDSAYEKQKMSFRQLKALAEKAEFRGHFGYAVCSPSQAQRPSQGADEREHVIKPQQVADSYEKVRVADSIVTINRTNKEKGKKEARVYLGKYRDNEDGLLVRVRTAYERGGFCEVGIELELRGEDEEADA